MKSLPVVALDAVREDVQAAYDYFVEPDRAVIAAVVDARRHPRLIRDMVRARR